MVTVRSTRSRCAGVRTPHKRPGFLLLWPSTAGGNDTAVVAADSWTLQADGITAIFPITTFDALVTSSPTTDLGRQLQGAVATSFPIRDSVGPVLSSARIRYGTGTSDTLALVFSEKVSVAALKTGLERLGVPVSQLAYVALATSADGLVWTVPVASGVVFPGDSIRPVSAGGFVDAVGNHPSALHRWVLVQGLERPPQHAWYSDVNGDGAVDQIHLRLDLAVLAPCPSSSCCGLRSAEAWTRSASRRAAGPSSPTASRRSSRSAPSIAA